MALSNLHDLFLDELRDLLNAEQQLIEALPKIAKAVTNDDLREAVETHLEETHGQVERLKQIFEMFDKPAKGKHCKGMEGVIKEGDEFLKAKDIDENVRDAGIISAAQRVEHYEMAGYGCAIAFAKELGYDEAVELLEETLMEEKKADALLSKIAVNEVNPAAAALDEGEGDEEEEDDEEESDDEDEEDDDEDEEEKE